MKYLSSRNYFFSPVLFFQDKQTWRNLWPVSLMLLECKYPYKYLDRGPKNRIMPLVPLFKKGDRSVLSNYRPVSLLSNIGKIQERIVFKHMYNHLVSNNLLFKYQSGFRPGHSTTFQLIDIFHHICQSFDEKQYPCMVFCDISKAFDKVCHKGLLFKLRQNGIKGNLLAWISNHLSSRKQSV